jgi:hypothetical protein
MNRIILKVKSPSGQKEIKEIKGHQGDLGNECSLLGGRIRVGLGLNRFPQLVEASSKGLEMGFGFHSE